MNKFVITLPGLLAPGLTCPGRRAAMNLYRLFRSLGMAALLLVLVHPANAANSKSSDEWQFDAEVYLWAASLDTTPAGGDNIHISFSDILDNLKMAFMGNFGARKGKWSMFSDIIYMNIGVVDEKSSTADKVEVEMKSWIVTAAGGYNVIETDTFSLDLLAGARYLWLELPLKFQTGDLKVKTSPSDHGTDGIIGVKGKVDLADKWYLTYYADAGAGDSDFTWQASTGLGYRFKKVDATFGYRYLDWNSDGGPIDDLTVKGPFAGVKFFF